MFHIVIKKNPLFLSTEMNSKYCFNKKQKLFVLQIFILQQKQQYMYLTSCKTI